jgi:hypothetical protein
LQLLAPRPAAWGSLNSGNAALDYARYGVWSASEGLARFPRFPSSARDLVADANLLLQTIARTRDQIPYALTDTTECWLCVGELPVALLAAATQLPERRVPMSWHALPENPLAAVLESAVRDLRGTSLWFETLAEGRRQKVGAGKTAVDWVFPELLLAIDAFPAAVRPLINTYLDQLAPRLLTLPLHTETRARLEQAAVADATGVAHFYRLYPAQCDAELITRLRVEARLRAAAD